MGLAMRMVHRRGLARWTVHQQLIVRFCERDRALDGASDIDGMLKGAWDMTNGGALNAALETDSALERWQGGSGNKG